MKKVISLLAPTEISIRDTIRRYKNRAEEIEFVLSLNPEEWGRYQSEFNSVLNEVFRNIMDFEKNNLVSSHKDRVSRLKKLFVNRIRKMFLRGEFIAWSLKKPYGYAGDYKIIDDIYLNNPATGGFDRLFDNYFQMSAISVAVRNRKEDFKRLITEFISKRNTRELRIMNLASGPCREIKEIASLGRSMFTNVIIDCYENDNNAIDYARDLLANHALKINFIKENVVRIALKKEIGSLINRKYDFIYSTGLFDYLEEKVAIRLIQNLKKLLKPGGVLAISDVRDKYSNPSIHFMEWVGEWYLVYREDNEFRKIFVDAGFKENELVSKYEQQGIMQYIIAHNNRET